VDYPLGLRSQGPEFKSPSGRYILPALRDERSESPAPVYATIGDLSSEQIFDLRVSSNLRQDVHFIHRLPRAANAARGSCSLRSRPDVPPLAPLVGTPSGRFCETLHDERSEESTSRETPRGDLSKWQRVLLAVLDGGWT